MNNRLYGLLMSGLLLVSLLAISGCADMGYANDVADRQDEMRMNRGVPTASELPPGLGDDMPPPAPATPQTASP